MCRTLGIKSLFSPVAAILRQLSVKNRRARVGQRGKAVTRSSRRIGRTKAIATVLAMIADAFPEPMPQRRCPARESDESLWDTAVEFCAAMYRYKRRARGGLRLVRE